MFFQSDFSFFEEGIGDVAVGVSDEFSFFEWIGFRHEETGDDEEDGRAGAEPVEWSPAVRRGVDETACEGCGEEVAEGIALLEHATDKTTSCFGTIF